MYLFIDTNIFLSFYHFSNEDLEQLEKLVKLIEDKEITLYLTQQVIDEIDRNRERKINDCLSDFKKQKYNHTFPLYCKDYDDFDELQKALSKANELHANLNKAIQSDVEDRTLKADIIIKKIYEIAEILTRTKKNIEDARLRMIVGNPPGKKDSHGDAINWEILLENCNTFGKLNFIANDKDYKSVLNGSIFNEFLAKEWQDSKKSEIKFFSKLSDFFKLNYPTICLSTESEKDENIKALSESSSFFMTHSYIEELSKYNNFTLRQKENLIKALLSNSQIHMIIKDEDVHKFYNNIHEYYSILSVEEQETLNLMIGKEPDIPF